MAMYLRELTIRFGTARAGDGNRVALPVGEVVASPREVANLLFPLLAHEPVEVFSVRLDWGEDRRTGDWRYRSVVIGLRGGLVLSFRETRPARCPDTTRR